MVGKNAGTLRHAIGSLHEFDQIVAIENIVPQHQGTGFVVHKIFANDEGLRQAIGAGLNRIRDVHAPLTAIAQEFRETRGIVRGADQQNIPNASQHQSGQRVVDHGLVVHRHELLGHRLSNWVQACARATGQDNAFARIHTHYFATASEGARPCSGTASSWEIGLGKRTPGLAKISK